MVNGHSPSMQHPPHESGGVDKNKLAIGAESIAVILQIAVSFLQLDSQTKIAFFVVFALAGLVILMWWSGDRRTDTQSPARRISNLLIGLLLGGTLIGVVAIAAPTVREKLAVWGAEQAPIERVYYMLVHVYRDDTHDGQRDGNPPLAHIPITIKDEFGNSSNHMTNESGSTLIHLSHFGEISVGICREFQTHHVGYDSDAATHPTVVDVGVDPSEVSLCTN